MKRRRLIALGMTAMLTMGTLAGCGGNGESSNEGGGDSGDKEMQRRSVLRVTGYSTEEPMRIRSRPLLHQEKSMMPALPLTG